MVSPPLPDVRVLYSRYTMVQASRAGASACVLAFCLGWFLAPVTVAAETAPPPAKMIACTVVPEQISRRGTIPETIRVSFSIEKDTAADVARFTATAPAGAFRDFTARGSFSKGTIISDRVLNADAGAPSRRLAPGTECQITYVHFVDGTSWTAPT